ncbi:MAG: flagellar basal body rod protein FlgB [Solirubrobacteraceae bacterium]|nr:flagellar basal body rod protein FlgB [Solirubrobacteraceae bacterium]
MDLFDTTQYALKQAISGTALRQSAIANNLANADTPGYQRQDVDFHSALKSAISSGPEAVQNVRTQIQADPTAPLRYDGSNIDVDKENAAMAENGLEQEALVSVSKARVDILKTALGVR